MLFLLFLAFILTPSTTEAAFAVYLKSGTVIRGVDNVTEENGMVKLYKHGITFSLQKTSIMNIEEYEKDTKTRERGIQLGTPGKESPGYVTPERVPTVQAPETSRKLQQLKARYNATVNRLQRLDFLEKKSKELKRRGRQKWSPRRARIAREELSNIEGELEKLRSEKDSLLEQKKELEYQIDRLE
jgi:hypothetical protein